MANNIIKRVWNQNRMVNIEGLSGAAFQAENGGHTFEISGVDDTGATVALSGTVTGVFRRPDNADIALTGSASEGVVSVTLTNDCYAVPGRFGLVVYVTSNSQKVAVYACVGTVAQTNGGGVAGETPQDVVDLINAIAAAVATIPPSYTDLMAAIAPTYSNSALYPVGSYAWYDGDLYRCTTPITTAETWTAAHWTAAVIGNDVSDLKNALDKFESAVKNDVGVNVDAFTSWENYIVSASNGTLYSNPQYICMKQPIPVSQGDKITFTNLPTGRANFVVVFYSAVTDMGGTFVSADNSIQNTATSAEITVPANVTHFRFTAGFSSATPATNVSPVSVYVNFSQRTVKEQLDTLSADHKYPYTVGKFLAVNGKESANAQYAITDFIICDNASHIIITDIWTGSSALAYAFYTKDKVFISGANNTVGTVVIDNIPSNAKYVRSSGRIDDGYGATWNPEIAVYNNVALNEKVEDLDRTINSVGAIKELNVLVFGDSITDTANITIDSNTDTTTAYTVKNPNNSYVKDGVTINYAMWPTLIGRVLDIRELRNYALAGAHFYTPSTQMSNPRLKLLYQVQVALNDLTNPNNVFPHDDFNPDIVIVACGINDGNIASGAFETTMAKTVMKSGNIGVDVEATMAALDQENVLDSMRYVLMLLKQTFPEALMLYVNPLQQTYSTNEARLIAREELGKMAEQYDFINLDGFGEFGVVRDFETQGQIGLLTKDGLHPNEKGQNLYARNIVQAIKRYYFPLNQFNP